MKVKGSTCCFYDEEFRNQQWKCELWPHHTQDGQHGYACQHPAAAVREIWGELDLIFTFSGMQVTTIEIPFCSPFFSCLALIKNFGPSRSKHTTKLTNPILGTVDIALCCFLCRRLSIGKFKLQVSFSLGSFVSDKNIWNALSISLLYLVRVDCRPTSQQIYKRTSSNLIRKRTGCDEYVEDQLNVASKNFAKYLFDDTDGKRYL